MTLAPLVWLAAFVLLCLVIDSVIAVTIILWQSRRAPEPGPPPYDWSEDGRLLDVWAREDEGEVTAILPAWFHRVGGGTREW